MKQSHRTEVVGTGFVVLDRIYENDHKAFEALGGSCANVLWSLAMLDRQVTPILRLGADDVGEQLIEQFRTAGADTSYIARRATVSSPILAQLTNTKLGTHSFSFVCPDTSVEFPRYQSIDRAELAAAAPVIEDCAVFFADRLSETIVCAMETAARSKSIIYFEPSAIGDRDLFARAIDCSTIVKFSSDRLGSELLPILSQKRAVAIMTHGSKGLEVMSGKDRVWCDAILIEDVKDTSGSGDMVSVGLINHLIETRQTGETIDIEVVLCGVRAGQRLAAANCSFLGARGLFQQRSARYAHRILHLNL
ncbi:PfkB family carbohydrate kinase [Sinorhizobium meliloti]|uniref:PfkB family carbohydrate kinase n=1 Tax=Rhizobium meliloti TaxID=382 RepID=UPI0004817827|nr:PfkB family carbohydrate kinase [Sinorhizobium meliloti]RVP19468.1 hypothetical protein CN080_25325 [Sinorhizobium meliloti]UFX13137.1 PfkB family carbohydrate kinase [Sinorhizobium meliloti]